jgi:hypothetical protein
VFSWDLNDDLMGFKQLCGYIESIILETLDIPIYYTFNVSA